MVMGVFYFKEKINIFSKTILYKILELFILFTHFSIRNLIIEGFFLNKPCAILDD